MFINENNNNFEVVFEFQDYDKWSNKDSIEHIHKLGLQELLKKYKIDDLHSDPTIYYSIKTGYDSISIKFDTTLNTDTKLALSEILKKHPMVKEVEEDSDQIRIVTKEDPDNSENNFGYKVLERLAPNSWDANDCEGCYNEYAIFTENL